MSTVHPHHSWCRECRPDVGAGIHHHTKACGHASPALLANWADPDPRREGQRGRGRSKAQLAAMAKAQAARAASMRGQEATPAQRELAAKASAAAAAKRREQGPTKRQLRQLRDWQRIATKAARARHRERGRTPAQTAAAQATMPIATAAAAAKVREHGQTPAQARAARVAARVATVARVGDHDDARCTSCGLVIYHSWRAPRSDRRTTRSVHFLSDPCPSCGGPMELEYHEPGSRFLLTGCAKARKAAKATA